MISTNTVAFALFTHLAFPSQSSPSAAPIRYATIAPAKQTAYPHGSAFEHDGVIELEKSPPAVYTASISSPHKVAQDWPSESRRHKSERVWLSDAFSRIRELRDRLPDEAETDSWDTALNALKDADALILKLADSGLSYRPVIGWDGDSIVSIYLKGNGLSADLSVYGDGTFSYSARKGSLASCSDESKIGGPLPQNFIDMLG
jgi:hypothetical protein